MCTAPGVCVCVCVSTAPGVCTWMGQIQRTHFTAGYTLYNYVCEKKKKKKRISFFTKPIYDYGKMLKYREKYWSISTQYTGCPG